MATELQATSLRKCLEKIIDYRGKTPKKLGSDWTEEGYRALSAINVKDSGLSNTEAIRCVDEATYRKWMKEEVKRGDILLTSEAPAGEVMLWDSDEKIVLSQRLFCLRTNKRFDNRFILYYLQSPTGKREVNRTRSGSTVAGISAEMFDQIQVLHPETSTQQKIAAVLSALDAKIDLNNRINAELEALAKTIYDYWFVQFDFPDAHGRPYKSSGGAMVWNDTLKREIPAGWCVLTIGDVILKQPKALKVPASSVQTNGSTPVIDQSTDFICGYTDEADARIEIETPHVVFGDHTRIVKLVCFDYARGADGTQVLVPNTELVAPFAFFQSIARVDLSNYGYARHFKFLKSAHIVVPEISLANGYDEVVRPLFTSVEGNRRQNRELTQLRDWLLPLLMNGQVRVA